MTQSEYIHSGCENKHCKFTLTNGKIEYGVITTFFPDEQNKYYLVRSPQMIEFKKYMDINDYKKMKELCVQINLKDIKTAERLDPFQELLINKKTEVEGKKVDWDKRKKDWLSSISGFYKKVDNWLSPFQKEGLLNIKTKEIDLNEEYIGNYKTNRLDIYLGKDIVSLVPRGTLIIGSYGRIDMRGPKGEALIVEPEWNNWKFAIRTPKMKYIEITEESFKGAIKEMING